VRRRINQIGIFCAVLSFSLSCNKKKSEKETAASPSTTPTTEEEGAGTLAVTTDLSLAVPDSLAIAVFPQTVDSTAATAAGTIAVSLTADAPPPPAEFGDKTLRQKIEFQKDVINGKAESCISESLFNDLKAVSEKCYEFDQDMIYGGKFPVGTAGTDQMYGTVNGKNSTGEACLIAFAREEVGDVVSTVEQSMALVQAAMCQANKDTKDLKLPDEVGKSMDLKKPLATALGKRLLITVEAGSLKRLEDSENRKVYKTTIVIVRGAKKRTINMVHSPAENGTNDTFNGQIWVDMEGSIRNNQPGPAAGGESKRSLFSIEYARSIDADTSEPRIQYELRSGEFAASLADKAFDAGILDFNANTNAAGAYVKPDKTLYNGNDGASNIKYVSFDMNPETNAGTLSYWRNPGSNYDENTRGLIFNLSHNDAGDLTGCANSGAASVDFSNGTSIRKALKTGAELAPQGFLHPFMRIDPLDQGCTIASAPAGTEDATGTYLQLLCPGQIGTPSQTVKWYRPQVEALTAANDFYKKQAGAYVTRQCYTQNAESGVYEIDNSSYGAKEAAGYELISTADTTKVVLPPRFKLPPPPPPGSVNTAP
jgi:hypothetical protein